MSARRFLALVLASALAQQSGGDSAPEPFARGQVRSDNGVSISADGKRLYATWRDAASDRGTVVVYASVGGKWANPTPAPFSGEHDDADAVESQDGERLYFASRRPVPGSSEAASEPNIWMCVREPKGWSEPRYLERVNSKYHDGAPCVTGDADLYFASARPGGVGELDIYRSRLVDGEHTKAELVRFVSSPGRDDDPFVSPDGRVMVFARARGEGRVDLFLAVESGGAWTRPVRLQAIDLQGVNRAPHVTPDGARLVFRNDERGLVQIPWRGLSDDQEP